MAFIDEITLRIKAGAGGSGIVAWRHEKGRDHAGPGGGNGGAGGSVYLHAVRDIGLLHRYRNEKEFAAGRGFDGMNWSKQGKSGADLTIDMPLGSIITNTTTGQSVEMLHDDEKVLLLKGGQGGLGNEHFKNSVNRRPQQSSAGKPGEEADFFIELRLVADIGLIGLPNAGKSSLLNALTNAEAKVGNYEFTTLEPNLGDFHGFILADIPGLIAGASKGKGLGDKFLRHIQRTKIIFHCISAEHFADLADSYHIIRNELSNYDKALAKKTEIIVLTKTDLMSFEQLEKCHIELKKIVSNEQFLEVCVSDQESIRDFKTSLSKILKK